MSHLNEQRTMANALVAGARQIVREMNAEAAARPAPRPVKRRAPTPVHDDFEPSDSCQCHAVLHPPCSWCTSDDNPLNAQETPDV